MLNAHMLQCLGSDGVCVPLDPSRKHMGLVTLYNAQKTHKRDCGANVLGQSITTVISH